MRKFGIKYLFISAAIVCLMLCNTAMAAEEYTTVEITGTKNYSEIIAQYPGGEPLHITGSGNAKLVFDNEATHHGSNQTFVIIPLNRALKIDNISIQTENNYPIYAQCNSLIIGHNVTTENEFAVYGGKCQDWTDDGKKTHVEIHSGNYSNVYGGGQGEIIASTELIVTGSTTVSGTVYGGGSSSSIKGETNVWFGRDCKDCTTVNCSTKYLFGVGNGGGLISCTTNVYIEGGTVIENVYGGGSQTNSTNPTITANLPVILNTNITMTGGRVQAVFGGNALFREGQLGNNLQGSTYVKLIGGEVTRRVYSGCYNEDTTTNWHVDGTTTLVIGPSASLCTGNGLGVFDYNNIGIYSGSRLGTKNASEKNVIIFVDNSYSTLQDKVGASGFNSYHDYIINCINDDEDDSIRALTDSETGELKFAITSDNRVVKFNTGYEEINSNGISISTAYVSAPSQYSEPIEVTFNDGDSLLSMKDGVDLAGAEIYLDRASGEDYKKVDGNQLKFILKDPDGNILGEMVVENENAEYVGDSKKLKLGLSGKYNSFVTDYYGDEVQLVFSKSGYLSVSVNINISDLFDNRGEIIDQINALGSVFGHGQGDIKQKLADDCGDGSVDIDDFIKLIRGFGYIEEDHRNAVDLNEDGYVGVDDLLIIKNHFGYTIDTIMEMYNNPKGQ